MLGALKTKSGGGFEGGDRGGGDVLGRDFVWVHFQEVIKLSLSCVRYHMVESRSLNGPYPLVAAVLP